MEVVLASYDPHWPEIFRIEAAKIREVLAERALKVEHVGSTSVPDLIAKPVIDILLAVADSTDETSYASVLEKAGYQLCIREPDWYEHRMFRSIHGHVQLHVFSAGCPEIERMLAFRNWLRINDADRKLYANSKQALAQQQWSHIQNYADAKTSVIEEIMARTQPSAKTG